MGIETQGSFAAWQSLSERTLNRWKERADFLPNVKNIRDKWAQERGGDVAAAIYQTAMKGNPLAQKLWMQVYEGFSEKSEIAVTKKIEIGVNDIRFLIEALPEPLKSKHYANLRELLDDSAAFANARNIDPEALRDAQDTESGGGTEVAEDGVCRPPDNDAQDIPEPATNEMAARNTPGVCEHMERQAYTYNNQSAAWWG